MSEKTRHAVERFPDLAQAIKQYSADNRFFSSLCEDYGEAVEMLRQWEKVSGSKTGSKTPAPLKACRALVADLEDEILRELRFWNDPDSAASDGDPPI
ncbi:hypothetical protein [Azospirillum canadense]|uniref:hypothetical protein n=1 Tax=Azospirillum canadense TaxID=403962 RepID=UPI0022264A33|nr:hypothetical protein [Azospirillum canadense]MCW2243120.1 hypothetical protein [Azospirillum canadense]